MPQPTPPTTSSREARFVASVLQRTQHPFFATAKAALRHLVQSAPASLEQTHTGFLSLHSLKDLRSLRFIRDVNLSDNRRIFSTCIQFKRFQCSTQQRDELRY